MVSNTRIFYNLLAGHKLQLLKDIQHYLVYTIKIMELANRFTPIQFKINDSSNQIACFILSQNLDPRDV